LTFNSGVRATDAAERAELVILLVGEGLGIAIVTRCEVGTAEGLLSTGKSTNSLGALEALEDLRHRPFCVAVLVALP